MVMTLEDFNGMEILWHEIPKHPDEHHVTLTIVDVDAMWHLGIVDTKQYSLEKWRLAFDAHKQPDDTYLLSKEEFLTKESYRYRGEVMIPFDSMRINEGKYTDEGLQELFELSIIPSCSLGASEMQKFIEELGNEFREPSGLIKIDSRPKMKIRDMINNYPSPLRRLELLLDNLIKEAITKGELPPDFSASQLAKIQASSFSLQPTSKALASADALRSLEKARPSGNAHIDKTAGVDLKKIKRSRKGFRG